MAWSNECYVNNDSTLGVLSLKCLPGMIGEVILWLLSFAGVVVLILLIIGGFKFIASGGDPKQVEGARKTITYALIGLVVILFSFAIINLIADVTGVSCIKVYLKGDFTSCFP